VRTSRDQCPRHCQSYGSVVSTQTKSRPHRGNRGGAGYAH
jgi:hypothetical protein